MTTQNNELQAPDSIFSVMTDAEKAVMWRLQNLCKNINVWLWSDVFCTVDFSMLSLAVCLFCYWEERKQLTPKHCFHQCRRCLNVHYIRATAFYLWLKIFLRTSPWAYPSEYHESICEHAPVAACDSFNGQMCR